MDKAQDQLKDYYGKYIVTDGFLSKEVIACNTDPSVAIEEARKKNAVFPVIMFVPEKDIIETY